MRKLVQNNREKKGKWERKEKGGGGGEDSIKVEERPMD